MTREDTIVIPKKRIIEAKNIRDELDSLIETAEILNNKKLIQSIRKSEKDFKEEKITKISSEKELKEFFRR